MSVFGSGRAGFFYPRIAYSSGPTVNLDFDDAVTPIIRVTPIRTDLVALSGARETLYERLEQQVTLTARAVDVTLFAAIWTYWTTWGALGYQAALTLDRFSGCTGQWEYDQHNATFTLAEMLNEPLVTQRPTLSRPWYALALTFRQGQ